MTQALWVLCLLLLAAGYIAAPSGPVLAAGLAALMLPVLSWLAVLLCRRKLRAELSCPASAEKGRPAAVRLTLRRPRALPVGRVRFHLAAENTVTGETACMTLPEGESAVSGRLCGCLTLRITGVTVWDAFSLLPVPAPCRARGQLCVMPDTFPLDMEDFQALRPRREGSVYDPAAGERTGRRPSRSGTTPPATACARSTGSSPAKPGGWWSGTRPGRWTTG